MDWDTSKENIQPTKKGRAVAVSSAVDEEDMFKQRLCFEEKLRTYVGNDPLSVWVDYVHWLDEHNPSGNSKQLRTIVQKCLKQFNDSPQYRNDPRWLRMWLKFASTSVSMGTLSIFEHMYSIGQCTELADYYIEWAALLETAADYKKVATTLQMGLDANAQPLARLQTAISMFEDRMARRAQQQLEEDAEDELDPPDSTRAFLGVLKVGRGGQVPHVRQSVHINNAPYRQSRQQTHSTNTSSSQSSFNVYSDQTPAAAQTPTNEHGAGRMSIVPTQQVVNKENLREPAAWNDKQARMKRHSSAVSQPSASGFEVYVDAPAAADTHRRQTMAPDVLSARGHDFAHPLAQLKQPEPKQTNGRTEVPMYNKALVYAGTQEFSFEELRAMKHQQQYDRMISDNRQKDQEQKAAPEKAQLTPIQQQTDMARHPTNSTTNAYHSNTSAYTLLSKSNQSSRSSESGTPKEDNIAMDCGGGGMDRSDRLTQPITNNSVSSSVTPGRTGGGGEQVQQSLSARASAPTTTATVTPKPPTTVSAKQQQPTVPLQQRPMTDSKRVEAAPMPTSAFQPPTQQKQQLVAPAKKQPFAVRETPKEAAPAPAAAFAVPRAQPMAPAAFAVNNNIMGNTSVTQNLYMEQLAMFSSTMDYGAPQVEEKGDDFEAEFMKSTKKKAGTAKRAVVPVPTMEPFEIYQDKPMQTAKAPAFEVFVDEPATPNTMQTDNKENVVGAQALAGGAAAVVCKPVHAQAQPNTVLGTNSNVPCEQFRPDGDYEDGDVHMDNMPAPAPILPKPVPKASWSDQSLSQFDIDGAEPTISRFGQYSTGDRVASTPHHSGKGMTLPEFSAVRGWAHPTVSGSDTGPSGIFAIKDAHSDMFALAAAPKHSFAPIVSLQSVDRVTQPTVPAELSPTETEQSHGPLQAQVHGDDGAEQNVLMGAQPVTGADEHEHRLTLPVPPKTPEQSTAPMYMQNGHANGTQGLDPMQSETRLSMIQECSREYRSGSSCLSSTSSAASDGSRHKTNLALSHATTPLQPISEQKQLSFVAGSQEPVTVESQVDSAQLQCAVRRLSLNGNTNTNTQTQANTLAETDDVDECLERTGVGIRLNITSGVNPWDERLINQLLTSLPRKLNTLCNFHLMNEPMPAVRVNQRLELGGYAWKVEKMLGQGAFARAYQALSLDSPGQEQDAHEQAQQWVLKVQKPACPWEFYICEALSCRLKAAGVQALMSGVMSVKDAFVFSDGSCLVNEFAPLGTILDCVNAFVSAGKQGVGELLSVYFLLDALRIVQVVHQAAIIHADIKPDNFVLTRMPHADEYGLGAGSERPCLKLIDWGRAIDTSLLPPGCTFAGSAQTSGFECTEMRDNRPWTYQTDFFGLLGTAHVLLFGGYMNVYSLKGQWKHTATFRRKWNVHLWKELFDDLMNVASCDQLPSLCQYIDDFDEHLRSCVSQERETWLSDLHVLHDMMAN